MGKTVSLNHLKPIETIKKFSNKQFKVKLYIILWVKTEFRQVIIYSEFKARKIINKTINNCINAKKLKLFIMPYKN